MVLAAWELGIGSVPATVYDHDRARELLGYPPDWHCEFILSFGHPADPGHLDRAEARRRPEAAGRPGSRGALVAVTGSARTAPAGAVGGRRTALAQRRFRR